MGIVNTTLRLQRPGSVAGIRPGSDDGPHHTDERRRGQLERNRHDGELKPTRTSTCTFCSLVSELTTSGERLLKREASSSQFTVVSVMRLEDLKLPQSRQQCHCTAGFCV